MRFVDELRKLQKQMPRLALVSSHSTNSDYTNYAYKNKNCYLVYGGHYNEDTYYSQYPYKCVDCADCDKLSSCELCYESVFGSDLYNCDYIYNCFSSSDCEYGFDLVNCDNCFLCAGLRTANYHIKNKPVPKEKYKEEVKKMKEKYSVEKLLGELEKIRRTIPHVYVIQKNTENCIGSFLENCENCFYCFNARNAEDCMYLGTNIDNVKDAVDCDNIGYDPAELLYECIGNSGNFNCNFCNACWHNGNLEHCELVFNSRDCFGCVSRSHAEYEILNKKYEKDEYYKKVAEIKSELKAEKLYNQWLFEPTYPYEDTIAPLYY